MAKVIKLPTLVETNEPPCQGHPEKTEKEIIDTLMQLAWVDKESFLSLEANCLSSKPVKISQRVKRKLKRLGFIDENGYSPVNVCSIVRSIVYEYQCEMLNAL